jgi:murein DD-endopeptidase MepM/ murein hydrolase activator NlpD
MRKRSQLIYINPSNSKIKKIQVSKTKLIISFISFLILMIFSLKLSSDLMLKLNYNSTISKLKQENLTVLQQLKAMAERINSIRNQMNQIESLDDELRATLDLNLMNPDVREVGVGGSDNAQFSAMDIDNPEVGSSLSSNHLNLARLEREIKLELESYQTLLYTAQRKKDSLRYLPILKPVPKDSRETDGFRKRRHPIIGRYLMHYGQDFGAKRGTPIFAPADGRVTFVGKNGAYGLFVTIDHKYGYHTNYGHLQTAFVKYGDVVKRGDKIGEVGNSGRSTAPHLHYEVYYQGKPVDPKDYYFPDISLD